MPSVRRGFGTMKAEQERQDANRQGDFIPFLRLRDDGDMARIRIVSEHSEEAQATAGVHSVLLNGEFHRYSKLSKSGKSFFTTSLCELEQDPETSELSGECPYCDRDITRSTQFMVWVYVRGILHKVQNSNPEKPWKVVKMGVGTMYAEEIGKFMVWQDGFFMSQKIEGRISRYDTLTDRDYTITRHGMRGTQKVQRDLETEEPSAISAEILAESAELPDLVKIATGEITKMDGTGEAEKSVTPQQGTTEHEAVDLLPSGEAAISEPAEDDLPF